ncbi:hypothetical protein OIU78_011066 [Salix suchowensis]|nr:hypothetical protein OIU78_011066 [Salix suchowensis]
MSPNDLPINVTRKNEIALLTLSITALTSGIIMSDNSRYRLK